MTPIVFWTDEVVARLRQLWDDDTLSARMIAAELGCTRNAVLGKAHRLDLPEKKRGLGAISAVARRIETRRYAERSRPKPAPKLITVDAIKSGSPALFLGPASEVFRAPSVPRGVSKTHPSYRNQLGFLPDMTVRQRRDMLAEAMRNTAALPVEG